MKSIKELEQQVALGKLYPQIMEMDAKFKSDGVNPDAYMEAQFQLVDQEFSKMKNEFLDPLTMGIAGAGMGAYHGYKALGGWDGVKNLAKTGWQGVKNTWNDLKAQHGSNMYHQDRQNLANLAHRTGSTVDMSQGTATGADKTGIDNVAQQTQAALSSVSSLSPVVQNNPQVKTIVASIQQALAQLQNVTTHLANTPVPTP